MFIKITHEENGFERDYSLNTDHILHALWDENFYYSYPERDNSLGRYLVIQLPHKLFAIKTPPQALLDLLGL